MPDKKNRTSTDDIIITDKGLEAYKTFATLAQLRILYRGLQTLFLRILEDDLLLGELWFPEFLKEYKLLKQFIEEVEDEYGHE